MSGPAQIGIFGKLPALGDFVRLGLPGGFLSVWDRWLSAELDAATQVFGADWNGHYMHAPIWRFALGPDIAGPRAVLGVMMPSVDRVGRKFPLTLVAPAPEGTLFAVKLAAMPFLLRLEELALSALDDTVTVAKLQTALSEPILPRSVAGPEMSGPLTLWSTEIGGKAYIIAGDALPEGDRFRDLFTMGADLSAPSQVHPA